MLIYQETEETKTEGLLKKSDSVGLLALRHKSGDSTDGF
jgi:hypothetical protein